MKHILVLGGTGFVGRHVCEKLLRQGWRVTVPTRRIDHARAIQHLPGLSLVVADVHDPDALQRLVAGHDAVVNLVAILQGNETAFDKVHVQLPRQIVAACQAQKVRRLVHISALGVGADAPSRYLRSKAAGEAVVTGSGLDWTVLRPSVIFGADDRFTTLFARLADTFPVLPLAGANSQFQPVWVEDVAEAVLRSLLQPQASIGQTFEACGSEVTTLGQIVSDIGRWLGINYGQGRRVIALPTALGYFQAWLMELLPGDPLLSRDNLESMQVPNVASGQRPGLQQLGIQPANLAGVVPQYLGQGGVHGRYNRFRKTAHR